MGRPRSHVPVAPGGCRLRQRQGACAVRTGCQGPGREGREGSGRATPGRVRSSALPRPSPAPGPGGHVLGLRVVSVWRRPLCGERPCQARGSPLTPLPRRSPLPEPQALFPEAGRAVTSLHCCDLSRGHLPLRHHTWCPRGPERPACPGRLPDASPHRLRSGDSTEAPAALSPDAFPPLLLWSKSPVNLKLKALQSRRPRVFTRDQQE